MVFRLKYVIHVTYTQDDQIMNKNFKTRKKMSSYVHQFNTLETDYIMQ